MSIRKIAASLLAAFLFLFSCATPSEAWFGKKIAKVAVGVVAADWAVIAGTAFVEVNIALRSAQLGSTAVSGLGQLLAAHRILGPRAVYISLAKRVLENPALFTRAVQVVNMIGLQSSLLDQRINALAVSGTPDPDEPEDCEPTKNDADPPYQPREINDKIVNRYQGGTSNTTVESDTVPPLGMPNVNKSVASPSGLVVKNVPWDTRGIPIFDKFALADIRVVDRAKFFASGVTSNEQMKLATLELKKIIEEEAGYAGVHAEQVRKGLSGYTGRFTQDQLKAIRLGRAQIPDMTWHHHQDPARMQLVPKDIHSGARHVGGWWLNRCRL